MTRTRSRNDKDLRTGGDHGQWVSAGIGHTSGQPDGMPQTFRQGVYSDIALSKRHGTVCKTVYIIVEWQ